MKNESFGNLARYYDLLYEDKDYVKEVDFIESLFEAPKPKKLIDLGCGTGNYSKVFAGRGYDVTGVDLSENMLEVAKQKCTCNFIQGDIRSFSLSVKFDACIAMFAVIGYITDSEDIIKVFKNVHSHLKPNGLFVFDVWNGLAVMRLLPSSRTKKVQSKDITVIRFAQPTLRSCEHICEVDYTLLILNKKKSSFNEINEKHIVRFYFPQETKYLLEQAGFEVLKICPFMDSSGQVDENVWNITFVARAAKEGS
jgi:SAM-dependent methyltransferase